MQFKLEREANKERERMMMAMTNFAASSNQVKKQDYAGLCQICHLNKIHTFTHGVKHCNPCRMIFYRVMTNPAKRDRLLANPCDCEKGDVLRCTRCRFKRCIALGMRIKKSEPIELFSNFIQLITIF